MRKCRQTEQCVGVDSLLLTSLQPHCHVLGHDPKSRLHQRGAADTAPVLECWNDTSRGPKDSVSREDRLGLRKSAVRLDFSELFASEVAGLYQNCYASSAGLKLNSPGSSFRFLASNQVVKFLSSSKWLQETGTRTIRTWILAPSP